VGGGLWVVLCVGFPLRHRVIFPCTCRAEFYFLIKLFTFSRNVLAASLYGKRGFCRLTWPPTFTSPPHHRTPDPTHFRPAFTHNCSGRTFVGQVSSQVLAAVGSTIKNVQTCIIKIKNFISPDTFLSGFPPKKERQEMCEKPRKNSAEKCS